MPLMTRSLRCKKKLTFHHLAMTCLGLLAAYGVLLPMHEARAEAGLNLNDYDGKVVLIDFWMSL